MRRATAHPVCLAGVLGLSSGSPGVYGRACNEDCMYTHNLDSPRVTPLLDPASMHARRPSVTLSASARLASSVVTAALEKPENLGSLFQRSELGRSAAQSIEDSVQWQRQYADGERGLSLFI